MRLYKVKKEYDSKRDVRSVTGSKWVVSDSIEKVAKDNPKAKSIEDLGEVKIIN
ncbi:hypothetical protein [Tenacibaculum sp. 190524A02b]|uniref:hypothetical protein n=1 Tax=Tenacibaculum vairaonense TaxID=3137860 RepID=UPI0031FB4A35